VTPSSELGEESREVHVVTQHEEAQAAAGPSPLFWNQDDRYYTCEKTMTRLNRPGFIV
jgi:hypothetical protein